MLRKVTGNKFHIFSVKAIDILLVVSCIIVVLNEGWNHCCKPYDGTTSGKQGFSTPVFVVRSMVV